MRIVGEGRRSVGYHAENEMTVWGTMAVVSDNAGFGNEALLAAFGLGSDAMLGQGGEAAIYALDDARVLRVLHAGGDAEQLACNRALLRELAPAAGSLPYAIPEILQIGEIEGRSYAIERRLVGRSVDELLRSVEGDERERLIVAYLEAADVLGEVRLAGWNEYGELACPRPLRAATWHEFLVARAARSLASAAWAGDLDRDALAAELASALPEPARPELVHLDAFAGNMLSDRSAITAVLDFGYACVAGDRRLNPLAAAVYLEPRPQLYPFATPRDEEVARSWLGAAGLLDLLEPARRWLAAFWALAADDVPMQEWCRSVLLD